MYNELDALTISSQQQSQQSLESDPEKTIREIEEEIKEEIEQEEIDEMEMIWLLYILNFILKMN